MRAACVQMCSGEDVFANLAVAACRLEEAAAAGARLAVLPENFSYMHPDDGAKRRVAAETVPAVVLPFLADTAAQHAMFVIGGSVLLTGESGKLRNASPVFGPDGACLAVYDKIHLFDAELPGELYRESELIEAGAGPVTLDVDDWRLGLSICYDLRFPELYRRYAADGCKILSIPSSFAATTGADHWEVLLRARAIENQTYVLAAAQAGTHPGERRTWGHSLIVDPWGTVIAQAGGGAEEESTLVVAELDRTHLDQVRRQLPALKHRRD